MPPQPLAYLDREFLESDEARPLRILSEYLEPLKRFKAQRIHDTVVFFGSARVQSREDAERIQARSTQSARPAGPDHDERLRRLAKAVEWSRYYEDAREIARRLTEWSMTLGGERHRFVVCSGGGPGIMEAANRGAHEAGGKTIGLNIRLPFEQGANRYITDGLQFEFHYFFMRKFWFATLAKALVVFPGGLGTLDEMFEILTLMQTQKLARQIQILLYGEDYWDDIVRLDPLVDWGAIAASDLHLLERVNTPDAAFDLLKRHLTEHHLGYDESSGIDMPGMAKTRS
ncbi:MAG: TIGR00730 family Rossman fold protein [Acidimicrobiia bacterium]|nr:TIGR00730 family Rossman fold protein [Acidimicrobiia bacterium]